MTATATDSLLLQALRGQPTWPLPVWMMRQAGRYLPEYQAIRAQHSFLEMCKTPSVAVEVSMQPWRRFGMDGVILFSDILVIPEAMGMALDFIESKGPVFAQPLRQPEDLARLKAFDVHSQLNYVLQAVSLCRETIAYEAAQAKLPVPALLGFSGAPWTLATYMIEGGSSKNFAHIRRWQAEWPEALHQLLDTLTEAVIAYLNAKIASGAQAVQLFDTWAGQLSAADYAVWVQPYHQRIFAGLNRHAAPAILFVNHARGLLEPMLQAGADVLSLDASIDLDELLPALHALPAGATVPKAFQGNLEPTLLAASPEAFIPKIQHILRQHHALQSAGYGSVFNLGHGLLPGIPPAHVKQAVDAVRAASQVRGL